MLLAARNLARRLGSKTLFEEVDFELDTGTTLVVSGSSGSGKSSLLRCLAGLDPVSEGEVLFEGKSLAQLGFSAWRSLVCYVAQRPPALRGSAREFVEQVASLEVQRGRKTESPYELAESWGLGATQWDQPFVELSGGEQQRALLAVAVSRKPRVLLLDEPTSALDGNAVERVEQSLRGSSVVWVTHDDAQAGRVAQRTLELD